GRGARGGGPGRPADDRPTGDGDDESLVPLRPAGPARPTGTVPATVHTRTAPARRGVSRIAAVLVLVPFVVLIAAAVFLFQPFKGEGEGEVRVRIQPGSSVDEIGKLLQDQGVVSNSLAFAIRARISGDGANLKAGTLRLKKGMSYGAALTALQQDPLPPSVVRVAIPEGLSRREIASSIRRAGVSGSYLTASAKSSGFDPRDFGQPRARKGLEGFLFPATYELQRGGATSKNLVTEQLKAFRTNFAKVSTTRARREGLSRYDVLIIASMIEREVRIPSERRLVSAVIWNRLDQDIALGIDATTRYAVRNWTRPLLQSEIDRDTPYDTRRRKGLPPTPIGSPGLAAMRAAANPARSSFLYYVVRPCGDGRHNFATTSAEFEKDRAAYNAAQRRAGGDPSPSDAKGC
ncbi:endolytic transglycosylase MltG, partial [Patulibacter sp.]|uniref:endolytic transglycosylase MltG n=1 Tax=Patulibacter sp. TaxID=1912859 RepID=UPI0027271083